MQPGDLVKEGELFFKQFLRSPRSMGSIIPSSRFLAQAVAKEVAWQPGQYVVELGGGTGSITQGLIDRGIPRENLIILEYDGQLYSYLKEHFPGCRVIQGDATRLEEILARQQIGEVSTIVSGVPMVGNPVPFRKALVGECFKVLKPGRFMLQYSYSVVCPIPAKELGLKASIARFVLLNVPPAYVWKYRRAA